MPDVEGPPAGLGVLGHPHRDGRPLTAICTPLLVNRASRSLHFQVAVTLGFSKYSRNQMKRGGGTVYKVIQVQVKVYNVMAIQVKSKFFPSKSEQRFLWAKASKVISLMSLNFPLKNGNLLSDIYCILE